MLCHILLRFPCEEMLESDQRLEVKTGTVMCTWKCWLCMALKHSAATWHQKPQGTARICDTPISSRLNDANQLVLAGLQRSCASDWQNGASHGRQECEGLKFDDLTPTN